MDISFRSIVMSSFGVDYFISHYHFLGFSPAGLMAPSVAHFHEVEHGNHRKSESVHEGLLSDHWEQGKGEHAGEETVSESPNLVLHNFVLALLQVHFIDWLHLGMVYQEMEELYTRLAIQVRFRKLTSLFSFHVGPCSLNDFL